MSQPPPFWRRAGFWWWLQALAVTTYLAAGPGLKAVHHVDTKSYLVTFEGKNLSEDLSSHRTWGYPLFLKAASWLPGGLDSAGWAQLGFYLVAVASLGAATTGFLGSSWQALAFCSPLLYCPLVAGYAAALRPELPAAAGAVATLATLLVVVRRPARTWAWALLALALAATYHTRPSYLFLLVWVPLAGLALVWGLGKMPDRRSLVRWAAGLGLAAVLPFLLWSALRWIVVGEFGLVSFGGINWIGITGSLLSRDLLPELPSEHRPLARQILRHKEELGLSPGYNFERLRLEYNRVIFECALVAIRKDQNRPKQNPRAQWMYANERFTSLSLAIVKARPGLYLRWLAEASGFTVLRLLRSPWMLLPALAALAAALVAWRRRLFRLEPTTLALAATCLGYAIFALGLVLVVETPLDRYVFAGALFLPGALLVSAVDLGSRRQSA